MKINKTIIQICFLIVSVILLAHSALPHIHHDGIVCITSEVSDHTILKDKCLNYIHENTQSTNHHHQNNNTEDDCLIRSINAMHNHFQRITSTLENLYNLSVFYTINLLNTLYLNVPISGFSLEYKPYNNHYHTPFVSIYRSLRAPPIYSFFTI